MLRAIHDADLADGGDSFWLDRTLARSFLSTADSHLFTLRRALYMYTHAPGRLGVGGGTHREPAAYTIQILDGSDWVDVPGQERTPATPMPNFNRVAFSPVRARPLRVLLTPAPGFGIGLEEIPVFDT
ncbi:MAG TPA: hypothetical protein VOB72_08915 [Candidatus Dormibacteraeota bacterium]|nr:hypothetical protein [Candidatus Dormibacteraeota bacterium]